MTNPGKMASYSSSPSSYLLLFLPCPAHSKTELQRFAHPRAIVWYSMLAQFGGGREGSKKFWITCLLEYGWAACECMCMRLFVRIAVYCSPAWVTWWLGSSGTSLDFLSPPMGRCWLSYLDGSFEEWKYDRSVRIATRGRFPLAQSALMCFWFF